MVKFQATNDVLLSEMQTTRLPPDEMSYPGRSYGPGAYPP